MLKTEEYLDVETERARLELNMASDRQALLKQQLENAKLENEVLTMQHEYFNMKKNYEITKINTAGYFVNTDSSLLPLDTFHVQENEN